MLSTFVFIRPLIPVSNPIVALPLSSICPSTRNQTAVGSSCQSFNLQNLDFLCKADGRAGCNQALAHICCNNFPENNCCSAADPFCFSYSADGLPGGTKVQGYDDNICATVINSCVAGPSGSRCCLTLGSPAMCSSEWLALSRRRGSIGEAATHDDTCTPARPNMMEYEVSEGQMRQIFIPQAKFDHALAAFEAKDVEALSTYETWGMISSSVRGRCCIGANKKYLF